MFFAVRRFNHTVHQGCTKVTREELNEYYISVDLGYLSQSELGNWVSCGYKRFIRCSVYPAHRAVAVL